MSTNRSKLLALVVGVMTATTLAGCRDDAEELGRADFVFSGDGGVPDAVTATPDAATPDAAPVSCIDTRAAWVDYGAGGSDPCEGEWDGNTCTEMYLPPIDPTMYCTYCYNSDTGATTRPWSCTSLGDCGHGCVP